MSVKNIHRSYEVVVVGGGMAGVCAAIASARNGSKTAIIQNRSMFGGNASSEIRMHILGAGCHMSKVNLNETGILMEILLENKYRNPNHTFPVWDTILWEKVKYQENLEFYLNTNVDSAVTVDDTIRKIICHQNTTETEFTISADVFVDATGHGTLGVMCGAESRYGSESTDEFQEPNAPAEANTVVMGNSLMFRAVKRDHPVGFIKPFWAYDFSEEDLKYRHHYNCKTSFAQGGSFAEYKEGEGENLPEFSNMDSGYWWIELGGQYENIIEQAEEIRDELLRCVYGVWNHIKNCGSHGAEMYELEWVGFIPGYRESRRLVGDYLLTENDIRENKIFDDAVAYGGWPMDEHVKGGILDFDKYPSRIFNFSGIYTIPYRCYYSKNVSNLMLAGRDISTSKMAFGSTRVMATCAIGGQAVGTAAAMAVAKRCTPREVGQKYIKALQQQLIKDDCYIPGQKNNDIKDIAQSATVSANGYVEQNVPEKLIDGFTRKINNDSHCWICDMNPSASVVLKLAETTDVHQIRLIFDPNLTQEIMPSITGYVLERQPKWIPTELVRNYEVCCKLAGVLTYSIEIVDNHQRLNCINLPHGITADEITICVKSTYGDKQARIFEVRIY
ncbi:MAG: FAD-dependent oxidoreductase [Angelakisella sp.]